MQKPHRSLFMTSWNIKAYHDAACKWRPYDIAFPGWGGGACKVGDVCSLNTSIGVYV